jgi:hypothetical protein
LAPEVAAVVAVALAYEVACIEPTTGRRLRGQLYARLELVSRAMAEAEESELTQEVLYAQWHALRRQDVERLYARLEWVN